MRDEFLDPHIQDQDVIEESDESGLRPKHLEEFIGQRELKEKLGIVLEAARRRGEAADHLLFAGPPGLGKTTLSSIIAAEMGVRLHITSGPALERAGDLAAILTKLEPSDVLFIDEIHRLSRVVEEILYPAMEDFKLDIVIDQGPSARTVRLNLAPFTLIGATTRSGMISDPLRSRFGMNCRLDYYTPEVLASIVSRSAGLLGSTLEPGADLEVARRARGTPRIANNLLRWVRDYALVRAGGKITAQTTADALTMLDIDADGFDEMDKRILEAIIGLFDGGPVGVNSLAVAIGEESGTIEEVHEPYLIMQGYIKRTAQGRVAMPKAYRKIGLEAPKKATAGQPELFGE